MPRSKTLDLLPSNTGHSRSLLKSIASSEDICDYDAVILIEQEGLHATDLRTLSPSSKLVQILSESSSQRQFQYLSPVANLANTAENIATRCGSDLVTLTPGSNPGHYTHDSRNVVNIKLPSLENQSGGTRKDKVALYSSQLADELAYLATTYPNHLVVYTGTLPSHAPELSFAAQHAARQVPTSPVFDAVYAQAPKNVTLPAGGILHRYQLLTPGIITVLLVAFFVLFPIVLFGFKALASIQSPLRVEAPKGFSSQDKKIQ
ncbi:hypothetical protein DXG03_006278 [Asterophora parasitica]|uniref:Protein BIG1 n=1 Tax=Asterophora parasitica TaxID=117018 RepID=A0A9P7G5D4_9AGAR|nr:hypothetical protein DXG03_006278 [Asterophora parasitica]